MPRRGENIYKRKDGRWEGRILNLDGKYRYFYAKAYREVKEKMKHFQEESACTCELQPEMLQTVAGQFLSWIEGDVRHQVKASTYESYQYCVQKYIVPFFSQKEEAQVTSALAAQFAAFIRSNDAISESYQRKILVVFKTALRRILKDTPNSTAILEAVKLPRTESSEVQVFSTREQQLIEHTALNAENPRTLGLILCFYSGIRLGELCGLKWGDFDWETGTMSVMRIVNRTKNFEHAKSKTMLQVGVPKSRKSVRKIPLPASILDQAKRFGFDRKCEEHYVLSDSTEPFDPRSYQKLFKKNFDSGGGKATQIPCYPAYICDAGAGAGR